MTEDTKAILNRPRRHRHVTWRALVRQTLRELGGRGNLSAIYAVIEGHPRTASRRNWRTAVRQALHFHREFKRVGKGEWTVSSTD